ncbi:Acyl-CoA synthetase family member 3 [Venturia nashicola]|nr:Acyl-CoA synthetase family member 3 [Venturia nashicola]
MDIEPVKKAKAGSKRHSTPSALIRKLSKRLSAPIRSQNKHAFRQNEHACSGETVQTTSLNELRGISQRGNMRSLIRPSSAASISMHSWSNSVMPTRPTSSVETSILGVRKISGPMISRATASSMLQKYSSDQVIYVGRRKYRAEHISGKEAGLLETDLPASKRKPISSFLADIPSENVDEQLKHFSLAEDAADFTQSSSEYVSPRSQWKMTISDLLTKEEQMPVNTKSMNRAVSHEHQASINETRKHLQDSIRSSTTTDSTDPSTPRTDLSEEFESSAGKKYSGPIFEEPCCISKSVPFNDYPSESRGLSCEPQVSETGGLIYEKPCCISGTTASKNLPGVPISEELSCTSETTACNQVTDGSIFEEPSCISDTDSLSDQSAASTKGSCDLHLLKTSITCPRTEDMFKNARIAEAAQEIYREAYARAGSLSLSNPRFHQALQPSPEDEEEEGDREDYFCSSQPSPFRSKSQTPPQAISKTLPVSDPTLLTLLCRSQDEGPSGEEMRQGRHALVMRILDRNPEKWSGGIDDLDVRIAKNKQVKENFEAMHHA